ncbi:MAG: acetyl-CoA carboxylase, carboxyltransferase subunit beta [Chlamydiales bacterium]
MGLFSRIKPKIKLSSKKDGYNGWAKCPKCSELVHESELARNLQLCPKCGHHNRLTAAQRIALLADEGSFVELFATLKPLDPLSFTDTEPYAERIKSAQKKSGRDEAVIVGTCSLRGRKTALGVLDFSFMGGSMGSVVGERLTRLIEHAKREKLPLIIVSASGGARMQESIFSLMQMAKTSAALALLHDDGLPFLSVLTNPTTGGVTASFAALGDVILAEPDALIGFAGPRVVEQTIRQKLPPKAQKSEFLLEKGMIDCIVNRHELKDRLYTLIDFFMGNKETRPNESARSMEELMAHSEE